MAFNFCEQKLAELREHVGEQHSSVGQLLCVMGKIYQDKNEDQAALTQYERALLIFEKCIPSEQERAKSCYNLIGVICFQKENFDKALECHTKALEIARKIYLLENPEVIYALRNVGLVHLKLKNYKKSIEYLADALKASRDRLFPDMENIQITQKLLNEARMSLINETNTS
jgi:tetratricopeptide (TPR) repeat protein